MEREEKRMKKGRAVTYILPVELVERIRVFRYRNMMPSIVGTVIFLLEKGLETAEKEGKRS